jgi:hypothetical protein
MKKLVAYLGLIVLSTTVACIDQIEIDRPVSSDNSRVVVEGVITDEPGPHRIRIFQTVSLGSQVFRPVYTNWVEVEDDLGNVERLVMAEEGVYLLMGNAVKGEIGRTYTLRFEKSNGEIYESAPETMLPVSRIDSIYIETVFEERTNDLGNVVNRHFADVFVDVELGNLAQSPFMRWELVRWYRFTEAYQAWNPLFQPKSCYVKEETRINQVLLFDGRNARGDRWERQQLIGYEVDWRFYRGAYICVRQLSLSTEGFNYWQKVDRVINQTGNIFDSPPAAVVGNMRNVDQPFEEVLGYFGASAVDLVYLKLDRTDFNNTFSDFCSLPNASYFFGSGVQPCYECLDIPGSTTVRPPFWE